MKKFFLLILVVILVVTSFSFVSYAEDNKDVKMMFQRDYMASGIKTTNGGNCTHFVEECFYQQYGLWLDLKDNYLTTIRALKGRRYTVDGKKYELVFKTEPTLNSIMFIDGKDFKRAGIESNGNGHVSFVTDIYTYSITTGNQVYGKDTMITVLESSTTFKSSYRNKYYYYDCWYSTNCYSDNMFPNVYYIVPELLVQ